MSKEFIFKKIKQMTILLAELNVFLTASFSEFSKNCSNIRASEGNFQLIVELASDINAHISLERGVRTPDNYKGSFLEMEKLGILNSEITKDLIKSANLRNILIHEYDFDQDNFVFYKSAKKFMATYKNYISAIEKYYDEKNI